MELQTLPMIASVFLGRMPELDAFNCLLRFHYMVPGFLTEKKNSVEFDIWRKILVLADKELSDVLVEYQDYFVALSEQLNSYSMISRPYDQVVRLFDFFLAFGPHMVLLCLAVRIVRNRDLFISSPAHASSSDARPSQSVSVKPNIQKFNELMREARAEQEIQPALYLWSVLPVDLKQRVLALHYPKNHPFYLALQADPIDAAVKADGGRTVKKNLISDAQKKQLQASLLGSDDDFDV
jgi:hypothetical protein